MRRLTVCAGLFGLLVGAGCSSDPTIADAEDSDPVASNSQYVVWLPWDDEIVTDHMVWHTKGRYASGPDNQGTKFLYFHREFTNRLRARHEAAGRPLSERTPWETLSEDPIVYSKVSIDVRTAYNNLINNVDPSTGQPFASEQAFGTYLEANFHNPLHAMVGQAYPSDDAAITPVEMSPMSSFFLKIHGLVERMHQAFLRGKFYQTTYSDVLGVSVAHQGSVDVVDANILQVSGAAWLSTAYAGRAVTPPDCGAYIGAVADFNFDGSNDLVVHYPNCGRGESVWEMKGTLPNNIPTITWPAVGSSWRLVGAGDFNSDLRPDLVWASGSTIRIWYLNGLTRLSTADATLGTNFVAKAVGAMYNGATCVVARHTTTGENRAYCLKGNTITNTFDLTTVSDLNWEIVGTGYYHPGPLDNKDILWQNKSTGQGRIWYLNGTFAGTTTVDTSYGSTSLLLEGPR
jgi:hypothetical protein